MHSENANTKLLKLLAVEIIESPRSTLQELAESVGISKATLHRCYRTRDNLEKLLMEKAVTALEEIIRISEKHFDDYREGIKLLINAHYENKEILRYVSGVKTSSDDSYWISYIKAIDSFFLEGQRKGVFKIDFSVQALSELFMSTICGMIDAERRGRIAPSCISDTIEKFFLDGAFETM
jgi:TetR/AcrR family transcriptional regulator, mexCD-oprJ operon repressor